MQSRSSRSVAAIVAYGQAVIMDIGLLHHQTLKGLQYPTLEKKRLALSATVSDSVTAGITLEEAG